MTIDSTTGVDTMQRVDEILNKGTEPHLLNGSQYLETLRDGRRVIDSLGQEIPDVTEHPLTGPSAHTFASVMDMQFDDEHRDIVTYVDDEGNRRARGWQVPRNREDLVLKREQIGVTGQRTLGMFGRPPEYGPAMSLGFLAIIDRIEKENPAFAENIRRFVDASSRRNLLSTDLIADPQSDRRIPRNERPGTLRVVGETDDSLVLRGSKIAGSSGAISNFFTLSTTLGEGLTPDAAIWAAIPVSLPGVSLVTREPTLHKKQNRVDNPLGVLGEEVDQIILFDDAVLPKDLVFSLRNTELLTAYFDSCVFVFWHILTRLAYRAELIAGTAQVVAETLGTDKVPGVRRTIADIVTYAQVLRGFSISAIAESENWNGVEVPNPGLVSAGRYYSISEYDNVISRLKDLCGQGLISRWPHEIWEHPEFGPKLRDILPGHDVDAFGKNLLFNFVWDLTTSANAGRLGMFEKVNATPPAFVAEIVYQHVNRDKASQFVRDYLARSR
ncbi:4-hydroxyphenylacetate 3-hydroxylase N-terminal domain-containing protein [Paenarthrobacter ureafaciens]|uniref:4-hydroxyphenylacetate 3-hydroxylase N-terminal domain-containing protein n=1 Tax=Paenarthrobacter ureafaciens TaxID=37931 RepID=UPI001E72B6ED|nr:4-hydroxyphenylacetate 3-hydroxylase N-terminal domain-containing protein [Paenarthrobacter ureafaciens]MEC3854188.1 4-hydroxyphenylacetate 3-hydroxylase N-terminal domain-containing protein [Paenarthrobacter ureafaciens]BCW86415.1 siderophore biosynthesis-related protein [Arthrobacter sp. NicSoilE8]